MKKRIELVIPKEDLLNSSQFGEFIYKNQVEEHIDFSEKSIIVIPEEINNISISFILGFMKNIFLKIEKEDFLNTFEIEGNPKVVQKFYRSLFI